MLTMPKKQRKGGNNVYRLENGAPQPVRVKTGITDNFHTEVISGELKPGEALIVRENNGNNAKSSNFKLRMF
jgi:HlyD family secretion protein